MIKVIALLTMLIDHIGLVLYPTSYIFRIIGRVSMPLFAYCIARGFYYSKQHGTLHKYLLNMQIFALISQMPYWYMTRSGFNIGYTWLISLLLLMVITKEYKSRFMAIIIPVLCIVIVAGIVNSGIFSVDYGFYGIITPLLFYSLIISQKENLTNYILALVIAWAYYVLIQNGSIIQIITIFSAFILTVSKKYDNKIKLPKWAFYAFYPVHIIILLIIDYAMV